MFSGTLISNLTSNFYLGGTPGPKLTGEKSDHLKSFSLLSIGEAEPLGWARLLHFFLIYPNL